MDEAHASLTRPPGCQKPPPNPKPVEEHRHWPPSSARHASEGHSLPGDTTCQLADTVSALPPYSGGARPQAQSTCHDSCGGRRGGRHGNKSSNIQYAVSGSEQCVHPPPKWLRLETYGRPDHHTTRLCSFQEKKADKCLSQVKDKTAAVGQPLSGATSGSTLTKPDGCGMFRFMMRKKNTENTRGGLLTSVHGHHGRTHSCNACLSQDGMKVN